MAESSDPTSTTGDPLGSADYLSRVRAEIEAEAELRRRREPELRRLERDIERAWIEVAPPGAAGDQRELLLDRADRLAMIDVDVPLGQRPGVRQVKGLIRKATYWYLRYVSDQLNALNNVTTRLLRRLDDRLGAVESAVGTGLTRELLDSPGQPTETVVATVAGAMVGVGPAPVVVLSAGAGVMVAGLRQAGVSAYGVEPDPILALDGVREGLDLRAGEPFEHLTGVDDSDLDGLVLVGEVNNLAVAGVWQMVNEVWRVLASGGRLAVVAEDPASRTQIERELRAGRGLSAASWCHLLDRRGFEAEVIATADDRVPGFVVARRP